MTRKYKVRNECVRGSIGVVPIADKMRENWLKRLGHVLRIEETDTVIMTKEMEVKREVEKEVV